MAESKRTKGGEGEGEARKRPGAVGLWFACLLLFPSAMAAGWGFWSGFSFSRIWWFFSYAGDLFKVWVGLAVVVGGVLVWLSWRGTRRGRGVKGASAVLAGVLFLALTGLLLANSLVSEAIVGLDTCSQDQKGQFAFLLGSVACFVVFVAGFACAALSVWASFGAVLSRLVSFAVSQRHFARALLLSGAWCLLLGVWSVWGRGESGALRFFLFFGFLAVIPLALGASSATSGGGVSEGEPEQGREEGAQEGVGRRGSAAVQEGGGAREGVAASSGGGLEVWSLLEAVWSSVLGVLFLAYALHWRALGYVLDAMHRASLAERQEMVVRYVREQGSFWLPSWCVVVLLLGMGGVMLLRHREHLHAAVTRGGAMVLLMMVGCVCLLGCGWGFQHKFHALGAALTKAAHEVERERHGALRPIPRGLLTVGAGGVYADGRRVAVLDKGRLRACRAERRSCSLWKVRAWAAFHRGDARLHVVSAPGTPLETMLRLFGAMRRGFGAGVKVRWTRLYEGKSPIWFARGHFAGAPAWVWSQVSAQLRVLLHDDVGFGLRFGALVDRKEGSRGTVALLLPKGVTLGVVRFTRVGCGLRRTAPMGVLPQPPTCPRIGKKDNPFCVRPCLRKIKKLMGAMGVDEKELLIGVPKKLASDGSKRLFKLLRALSLREPRPVYPELTLSLSAR